MFNPEKPYNELPFLPPKINFESKKIMKQLMNSKIALARLDTLVKNKLQHKEIFLEHFAIRESVESSQIENINTTVETTYQAQYEDKLSPEQKETLNYKKALLHGYSLIERKGFLSINGIQELGQLLSPGKGVIRTTSGVAIKKSSWFGPGETLYTPPIGMNSKGNNAISDLLKNFESFYNSSSKIDPLIQLALIHYQFEAIHPFYDGNGRTGRVLMILHMILHKQLCFPILFISGFINKHKSDYYSLLMKVTTKGNREEFILYILVAIEKQAQKTIETIEKLIDYKDGLRKKLFEIDNIKPKDLEVIHGLLSSKVHISLAEMIEATGVSKDTGTKIFRSLVSHGFGKEKKIGKIKVLLNKDFLKIFDK